MTKDELLLWYKTLDLKRMPRYIDIDEANEYQVCYKGKWQNIVFAWSVFKSADNWKYVETDFERGYVLDYRLFNSESDAAEYAKDILDKKYRALNGNSKKDMICRYMIKHFGYSEKRAKAMVEQIAKHSDIFEEFFDYARLGKFDKDERSQERPCSFPFTERK